MFLTKSIKTYETKSGKAILYRDETDGKVVGYQLNAPGLIITPSKMLYKTDKTAKKHALEILVSKGLHCGHVEKDGYNRQGMCRDCFSAEHDRNYEIIRIYYPSQNKRPRRTGLSRLTLNEAQAHCSDPNTRKDGVYFDGYREMR